MCKSRLKEEFINQLSCSFEGNASLIDKIAEMTADFVHSRRIHMPMSFSQSENGIVLEFPDRVYIEIGKEKVRVIRSNEMN